MILKKLDINRHDTKKVSELIYATDAHTYRRILRNKSHAINKIEELLIEGNNSIGYEHVWVVTAKEDNQVLGVLVTYKRAQTSIPQEIKTFWKLFSPLDTIRFLILELIDDLLLARLRRGDFYLACVAVDEKSRGLGIGTFILEHSLELARDEGMQRAVLNVDVNNKGAKRLYERFGFKVFGKNSFPWIGGEKGMYHMEYLID
jgi:ribosomal protein S18 acetylase RimI-like enzyme